MTFRIPAHFPVDGGDFAVQDGEVLAGFDRFEQQEGTSLDKDGNASRARTADFSKAIRLAGAPFNCSSRTFMLPVMSMTAMTS
jgi:hypothetical protein